MGAGGNVLNAAYAGGADPNGLTDSTTAIQDTINAVIALGGGTVYLPQGTYQVAGNLTMTGGAGSTYVPVYLAGAGYGATVVNFTGSGDCVRIYWAGTYSGNTTVGGGVTGITFNGSGASSGAVAVHAGDIESLHMDFAAVAFTGSGACALHADNQYNFTERLYGNVRSYGCQNAVIFDESDNSGGSPHSSHGSFARLNLDIWVTQDTASFNGVVLQNGVFLYDGALSIRGNFSSSASSLTSAVLTVTGSSPAGHPSTTTNIFACRLDIGCEVDNANANKPQTIVEGTPGTNYIQGTYGVIDFAGGAGVFATTNMGTGPGGTLAQGAFHHIGPVNGDLILNPGGTSAGSGNHASIALTGTLLYGRNPLTTSGNFFARAGDFGELTLTGNTTINLAPGGYSGTPPGAPQRITIILIQAASGGPYTVTWPSSGSPTTSSPTTVWPAGVAPAMPSAASAQLCVLLETYDGATWFGHVVTPSAVSIAAGGTGQVTAAAAFGALAPLTTKGDLLFENGTPAPARLAVGSTGQLLAVSGGVPVWQSLDATAADIAANGTQAAGSVGLPADSGHVHPTGLWLPGDNGLLAATSDPGLNRDAIILIAGTVYLRKIIVRSAFTAAKVCVVVTSIGNNTGGSAGTFAGLYSSSGSLLSGSSDVASQLTSTGFAALSLTTPQALSAGTFVWAALLVNLGTTQPTLLSITSQGTQDNANLGPSNFRTAVNGTLATSLPSPSITPGSNSSTNRIQFWVGVE